MDDVKDVNEDVNKKLMEFFDDKKNWNENEIKHGRSWLLPELRIKSSSDLHKIWYVLLKERNMLKTMEHEHKIQWKFWANPERLDKVEESMKNIETVVVERNRAYYELETGMKGESAPHAVLYNELGLKASTRLTEHNISLQQNKQWQEENPRKFFGFAARKFLKKYNEKQFVEKKKAKTRDKNHVIRLLSRFPDLDKKMLAEKYPNINLKFLEIKDKYRGHYVPRVD